MVWDFALGFQVQNRIKIREHGVTIIQQAPDGNGDVVETPG